MSFGIWLVLGIDQPTMDKKEIKKAYAIQVKKTRPDEDPAGFQVLYQAYTKALAYAETHGKFSNRSGLEVSVGGTAPHHQEETSSGLSDDDDYDDFDPVGEPKNQPDFLENNDGPSRIVFQAFKETWSSGARYLAVETLLEAIDQNELWLKEGELERLNLRLVHFLNGQWDYPDFLLRFYHALNWSLSLPLLAGRFRDPIVHSFVAVMNDLAENRTQQKFETLWQELVNTSDDPDYKRVTLAFYRKMKDYFHEHPEQKEVVYQHLYAAIEAKVLPPMILLSLVSLFDLTRSEHLKLLPDTIPFGIYFKRLKELRKAASQQRWWDVPKREEEANKNSGLFKGALPIGFLIYIFLRLFATLYRGHEDSKPPLDIPKLSQQEIQQLHLSGLLSAAIRQGNQLFVHNALNRGADPNFGVREFMLPLHEAIESDQVEIARILLEAGAVIQKPSDKHRGTRALALERGNPEMIALIETYQNKLAVGRQNLGPDHE